MKCPSPAPYDDAPTGVTDTGPTQMASADRHTPGPDITSTSSPSYWDFGDEKEDPIHRIHAYPAKFPAFITTKALRYAKDNGVEVDLVADVFCGCGTTAVEAMRNGKSFWGCDINPIATLIAHVKTRHYDDCGIDRKFVAIMDHFQGADDDIRCGDLFKLPKGKYLLNIRADCDCVPRDGLRRDDVELYCIKGEKMRQSEVAHAYEGGHFRERRDQSIVFAATGGKSIRFRFKNLRVKAFGTLKEQRIGRVLHPYLTRIQQRYALYLQRQGLPSVPAGAVSTELVDSAG